MKNVTFVKCGAVVLFVTALFTFVSSGKTKSADLKSAQSLVEDIPTIQSFLDAGLATELMAVEANLLGYGAKIISSPTIALNGENKEHFKKILGIPSDMNAKAVLLIGKYDQKNLDAVTGATTRKDKSEVVTFVK